MLEESAYTPSEKRTRARERFESAKKRVELAAQRATRVVNLDGFSLAKQTALALYAVMRLIEGMEDALASAPDHDSWNEAWHAYVVGQAITALTENRELLDV